MGHGSIISVASNELLARKKVSKKAEKRGRHTRRGSPSAGKPVAASGVGARMRLPALLVLSLTACTSRADFRNECLRISPGTPEAVVSARMVRHGARVERIVEGVSWSRQQILRVGYYDTCEVGLDSAGKVTSARYYPDTLSVE
jgi:hypothetical protein